MKQKKTQKYFFPFFYYLFILPFQVSVVEVSNLLMFTHTTKEKYERDIYAITNV